MSLDQLRNEERNVSKTLADMRTATGASWFNIRLRKLRNLIAIKEHAQKVQQ
jgi:hypothetical protein